MRNPHGSSLSVGDKVKKKSLKLTKLGSRENTVLGSNQQEPDLHGVVETVEEMTLKPRPEI